MRIASATIDGIRRFGSLDDDGDLHLFAQDRNPLDAIDPTAPDIATTETRTWSEVNTLLEPPLPVTSMRDFITFEQHTAGSMRAVTDGDGAPDAWYEAPAFYFTNPHAAIGSGHKVQVPPGCHRFDVELEVAIVISHDGFNLSVEEAWNHIGGLTILNDWSARDLQTSEMRVGLGPAKGKDSASTLGPVVVTLDDLEQYRTGDGEHFDLGMELWINDRLIGGDTLASMAWSFAELVSYASRGTWVRRGDVLGSGTCGGGCLAEFWGWTGETDPAPVGVGDTVTMTVEGLGTITNTVTEGVDLHPVPPARSVKWSRPV